MKLPPGLDPARRLALAEHLLGTLQAAAPGALAVLRGSLAEGRADPCSDIDLLWELPDAYFATCMARLDEILSAVDPLESLRSDPAFQHSSSRRLLFVQFAGQPLFWRVDIEVFALSVGRDPSFDLHNPAARGDDWSPVHSALMNVIAALKALLRSQPEQAAGLLQRGFQRLGLPIPPGEPAALVTALCLAAALQEPAQAGLSERILALHRQIFE